MAERAERTRTASWHTGGPERPTDAAAGRSNANGKGVRGLAGRFSRHARGLRGCPFKRLRQPLGARLAKAYVEIRLVEVLLRYGRSNGWLDGQPAVVSRPFGRGRITYIGAVLDEKLVDVA